MRYLMLALLGILGLAQTPNQPANANVETSEGLHTATFSTAAGTVRAYFPDDAAAGDTISGTVVADPSGSTPEQKEQNLGVLTGTVIEVNRDQKRKVEREGRAKWIFPVATGAGVATVVLVGPKGEPLGQTQIPVGPPQPADPLRRFELPTTGSAGHPIAVKGPFDGDASTTRVTIGGEDAKILAESPRQAVFSSPVTSFGLYPMEVRKGDVRTAGQFRNVGVRLTATKTNLIKGETATLTVTVLGLQGITEPAQVTLTNVSPSVVAVAGGLTQTLVIMPAAVRADGTYSTTRIVTGIRAGGFNVSAFLQRPLAESVDLPREADRVMNNWQQANRISITADARRVIRAGISEARGTLDRLVKAQARAGGSPDKLLEQLLRHYCFDLRDAKIPGRIAAVHPPFAFGFQPGLAMPASIEGDDARRLPFPRFADRFDSKQPESYLDLRSRPNLAVIRIDGNKLGYTDRSAVVPAGSHQIEITLPQGKTCKKTVKLEVGSTTGVSCPG